MPRVKSSEKNLTTAELRHQLVLYKKEHCPPVPKNKTQLKSLASSLGIPTSKPRAPPKPRAPRARRAKRPLANPHVVFV